MTYVSILFKPYNNLSRQVVLSLFNRLGIRLRGIKSFVASHTAVLEDRLGRLYSLDPGEIR